jgi:hypothetical protein
LEEGRGGRVWWGMMARYERVIWVFVRYFGREGSIWIKVVFGEWADFGLFFFISSQSEGLKKEGFFF